MQVMGDAVYLCDGTLLFVNGAQRGRAVGGCRVAAGGWLVAAQSCLRGGGRAGAGLELEIDCVSREAVGVQR